ncbi:hypothetical protein FH972_023488 [Carpinus fangiana]|uniref:Protein kinase domain-containing protein n=1 Tax=Carpinus fangiana TaxID=176857 RepID=A0A5N6KVB2_9ROSI|nr:hypothetical protein FH972_023488 [Carpinus fangiana]
MNQGDTDEQQRTSRLIREVRVLENLSHPNIISLERAYLTPRTMYLGNILRMVVSFADTHPSYIFQELVTSGDLFSYLEFRGGRLDDLATAVIVRQILQAVRYLHQHGIVHRDLKPENILMTSFRDGARVVVTDFGLSRFLPGFDVVQCSKLQRMESQLGTPSYAAPEMMDKINKGWPDKGYTKAVDLWSVGVITQCLLSGSLPFEGLEETQTEIERTKMWQKAIKCNSRGLDDRLSTGETIGERPKDFIRGLIILDGHQRMSADAALAHSWFTNRYHKKEFEALYKRAIEKWTSRHKPGHMLENLRVPSVLGKTKRLEPGVSQAMHCHKQSIPEPVLTKLLSSSTSEPIDTEPRISSSQASLCTKHKACQCITTAADILHLQDKPSPVGRSNTTVEETGRADYDVSRNKAETELLCGTQFSEHSYNGGLAADLVAPAITDTATCIADSSWLNT